MRSQKRLNKARLLVVPAKGIASTLSLELVMLFCKSGFDVYIAGLDGFEKWFSETPALQLTGHSIYTSANQPNWAVRPKKFDMGIVISPSAFTQQELIKGISEHEIIDFIMTECRTIQILQTSNLAPSSTQKAELPPQTSFKILPSSEFKLGEFYQKIFSETLRQLGGKKQFKTKTFAITHKVPDALSKVVSECPDWVAKLNTELAETGFTPTPNPLSADIHIRAYDGPQVFDGKVCECLIDPPDLHPDRLLIDFIPASFEVEELKDHMASSRVFIKRHNNGLTLTDSHGTRLLPDVSGQCCYRRLSDYVATHMSRQLSALDDLT